jgi:hypothetical protein
MNFGQRRQPIAQSANETSELAALRALRTAAQKSAKNALSRVGVPDNGHDGDHLISVSLAASRKHRAFGLKKCATNPVGMRHCAETCSTRFSAHAGRLHARLDR